MLKKDLNDELIGKMYNWMAGMLVREKRNEYRFQVLFELFNKQATSLGFPPITLEEIDREFKFTEQDIKEKIASDFFDLPDDLGLPGKGPTPEEDRS